MLAAGITVAVLGQAHDPYPYVLVDLLINFASINVALFVANLIPLAGSATFSDSAQLMQILRGSEAARLDRLNKTYISITVSRVRPRDFEIEALEAAARATSRPEELLMLHCAASMYYFDLEDQDELTLWSARRNLEQAGETFPECGTVRRSGLDDALPAHGSQRDAAMVCTARDHAVPGHKKQEFCALFMRDRHCTPRLARGKTSVERSMENHQRHADHGGTGLGIALP